LVSIVLLSLLGISLANQWYANHITLPRYCDEPVPTTVERVRQLLAEQRPADDSFESRRPYIIAAKLLFLLPRGDGESEDTYLARLQRHLQRECGRH
jgi:hypothetical protein